MSDPNMSFTVIKKHLKPLWLSAIKYGKDGPDGELTKKTVECRLANNIMARIKVGRLILFYNNDTKENVMVTVVAQHKVATFREALEKFGLANVLPGVATIEEGIGIYREIYSKEDEEKYGVAATEFSLD